MTRLGFLRLRMVAIAALLLAGCASGPGPGPGLDASLPIHLERGTTSEGYVYASHARGGRFVDVRLSGHRRAVRMRFAVLLPT